MLNHIGFLFLCHIYPPHWRDLCDLSSTPTWPQEWGWTCPDSRLPLHPWPSPCQTLALEVVNSRNGIPFAVTGIPSTVFFKIAHLDFNPWQIALYLDHCPVSRITIHLTDITRCSFFCQALSQALEQWISQAIINVFLMGQSGFSIMTSSSPAHWNHIIGHSISPETWRWHSDPLKVHCHSGYLFLWARSTWSMTLSKETAWNFCFQGSSASVGIQVLIRSPKSVALHGLTCFWSLEIQACICICPLGRRSWKD